MLSNPEILRKVQILIVLLKWRAVFTNYYAMDLFISTQFVIT